MRNCVSVVHCWYLELKLIMLNATEHENFNCSQKLKMQMKKLLTIGLPNVVFIMLINVKMPTIVISRINFMLS